MQQEKFCPQGWLEGLSRTLGKETVVLFPHLQTTCNRRTTVLRPQLTIVVFRHPQLASLHNKTKLVTDIFVIFVYKNLKENNLQNNKGLFLWLKQDRGSWFY
jgi:hypothetical protein